MVNNFEKRLLDAEKLREFMSTIPNGELSNFIDSLTSNCNIRRTTYQNWRSGLCQIPDSKKLIIEELAGRKIWN